MDPENSTDSSFHKKNGDKIFEVVFCSTTALETGDNLGVKQKTDLFKIRWQVQDKTGTRMGSPTSSGSTSHTRYFHASPNSTVDNGEKRHINFRRDIS